MNFYIILYTIYMIIKILPYSMLCLHWLHFIFIVKYKYLFTCLCNICNRQAECHALRILRQSAHPLVLRPPPWRTLSWMPQRSVDGFRARAPHFSHFEFFNLTNVAFKFVQCRLFIFSPSVRKCSRLKIK